MDTYLTLPNLIKTLESAERPSREMDAKIRALLLAEEGAYAAKSKYNGEWCIYRGERNGKPRLYEPHRSVPHELWISDFTRSVDAAIALCERLFPVYRLDISIDPSGNGAKLIVWPAGLGSPDEIRSEGASVTPALAIVIATLRAKLQETTND